MLALTKDGHVRHVRFQAGKSSKAASTKLFTVCYDDTAPTDGNVRCAYQTKILQARGWLNFLIVVPDAAALLAC